MAECERILQARRENVFDRVSIILRISNTRFVRFKRLKRTSWCRQASTEPIFRGRKLVLTYTDGSPCDDQSNRPHMPRKLVGDDEGEDKKHGHDDKNDTDHNEADKGKNKEKSKGRRKSTIISMTCDRESLAAKAHVSFVSASLDECTYFFEAKSIGACGGVIQDTQQTIGPGGVFGVM